MRIATYLLVIFPSFCYSQTDYESTLRKRLNEIRELELFDNSVVVYDDTSYYDISYQRWDPHEEYYVDDIISLRGICYQAVVDNKGKIPASSSKEWVLLAPIGSLPYRYLRDTARSEDLKLLLGSDHPYIRTYAFAALAHRKADGLFEIVLKNLKDTTRITQMTGDYGYDVSPADMMLSYSLAGFTNAQKDTLKRLILMKYSHLRSVDEVLIFHQASARDYAYVRAYVKKNPGDIFGLVALSKYCKRRDIDTIFVEVERDVNRTYYRGYKIFYHAIENCPERRFRKWLISQKKQEFHENAWIDEYYVRALASYKDKDCLEVLTDFARRKSRYKSDNLAIIYRALVKYYSPLYDPLIDEMSRSVPKKVLLESAPNRLEESHWNY